MIKSASAPTRRKGGQQVGECLPPIPCRLYQEARSHCELCGRTRAKDADREGPQARRFVPKLSESPPGEQAERNMVN